MTFMYELDPYSLDMYTGCAYMNFLRQDFRKLSSDRQTGRQTDRHDRNYIPRRFTGTVVKNEDWLKLQV